MKVKQTIMNIRACFFVQVFIANCLLFYTQRELIKPDERKTFESKHFRTFFMGVIMWVLHSFNSMFNHEYLLTYFYHLASVAWLLGNMKTSEFRNDPLAYQIFILYAFTILYIAVIHFDGLKQNKMNFYKEKQILKLIGEQKKIYDKLPDGLLIHDVVDQRRGGQVYLERVEDREGPLVSYVNETFKQMFLKNK